MIDMEYVIGIDCEYMVLVVVVGFGDIVYMQYVGYVGG